MTGRNLLFSLFLLVLFLLLVLLGLELAARLWVQLDVAGAGHEWVEADLDYRDTWRKQGLGPGG